MRFVEADKLPVGVVRKEYTDSRHALCCLECGFESDFGPQKPESIGKHLYALVLHGCPDNRD